jgi:Trk K+ transport system NAD-binding subunit
VIIGDATLRTTLDAARVEHARAIAVLTEDDMVNIETAIVVREILGTDQAPQERPIPVVLRILDRDLGDTVERDGKPTELHPRHDTRLHAGETAYLVGPHHELLETLRKGQRDNRPHRHHPVATTVDGLGLGDAQHC